MLACLLLASSCARSAAPVAPDSLPKPDGGAMMETVKALASTDNARVAGTEGEEGAAAYLAERFRSLGLEVSIDEFPILAFRTTSASLGLGSGTTLRADALLYSP
ncbi:MAG TPA: hypothetical protein VFL04_01750, partial [Rectinemataceae bacterium]|nr:hypothetical protein [Rectinemataceae bacterium]